MDQPLGRAVGNALEVKEAISVLKGETRGDLLELCLTLGSCILTAGGLAPDTDTARAMLQKAVDDGSALNKLCDLVEGQGGSRSDVLDTSRLPAAPVVVEVKSPVSGYVSHIEADEVGLVSMHLGGGRVTKDSTIDLSVGIILNKKVGELVEAGEPLAVIHAADEASARTAVEKLIACYEFSSAPTAQPKLIKQIIM